ncbi:MAG: hypothetical protein WCF92_01650 [bacterium]
MNYFRKKYLFLICVTLLSSPLFLSSLSFVKASNNDNLTSVVQSTNVLGASNTLKQQLISSLVKLIAELQLKLQNLLATNSSKTQIKTIPQNLIPTSGPLVNTQNSLGLNSSSNFDLASFFGKDVRVYNASPYQVKPGQTISIKGQNFVLGSNDFYFGGTVQNTQCTSSIDCKVQVPLSAPLGKQNVSLKNKDGSSDGQKVKVYVFITNNPASPSVITSIVPNIVTTNLSNVELTIQGKAFAPSGNYVNTPMGIIGPINSSDGKNISFNLKLINGIDLLFQKVNARKTNKLPMPVIISNEYGISEVGYFYISYKI